MMIELAVGIVNRQQHLFWQQPCLCMSIIWYLIYMMYTVYDEQLNFAMKRVLQT